MSVQGIRIVVRVPYLIVNRSQGASPKDRSWKWASSRPCSAEQHLAREAYRHGDHQNRESQLAPAAH